MNISIEFCYGSGLIAVAIVHSFIRTVQGGAGLEQ